MASQGRLATRTRIRAMHGADGDGMAAAKPLLAEKRLLAEKSERVNRGNRLSLRRDGWGRRQVQWAQPGRWG